MSASKTNREAMPCVARFVDDFRNVFGADCKVIFAREGGVEIGTPPKPFGPSATVKQTLPASRIETKVSVKDQRLAKKEQLVNEMLEQAKTRQGGN